MTTSDPTTVVAAPAPAYVLRAVYECQSFPVTAVDALRWLTEQCAAGNPYAQALRTYHDDLIAMIEDAHNGVTELTF